MQYENIFYQPANERTNKLTNKPTNQLTNSEKDYD
jgi:hypothetical protein